MTPRTSERLRRTNDRVRGLLHRMQCAEGDDTLVTRQDFENLLMEVTRAAAWLHHVALDSARDTELAKEISDYRSSLERLQRMLPSIQRRLLAEKVRLEGTRAHLTAARAWANASQGTL